MIGIVIVSHSRALATALVDLIQQVSNQPLSLAVAAGAGPGGKEFGTNAIEIAEAIQSVYSPEGVLVLMDLGSAILSAEMALELVPEEIREKVRFCAAPLVEGAVSAGVQAGLGSDLETACREASQALIPKAEQLGLAPEETAAESAPPPQKEESTQEAAQQVVLTLRNEHGLHARPAARFVQAASSFDADVSVENLTKQKGPVSARSLNAIARLEADLGDSIGVSASGPESEQALKAIKSLVEEGFGERIPEEKATLETSKHEETTVEPLEKGEIRAVPVSDGIAIGPFYPFRPLPPPVPDHLIENPEQEWERLEAARDSVRAAIQHRRLQTAANIGESEAAIFDAHLMMLEDPELTRRARELIFDEKQNAALAWHTAIKEAVEAFQDISNDYLRERAADVADIGDQVLYALAGESSTAKILLEAPVILFAHDLTPSQTAQLDMEHVLGVATVAGGPTSHSAILARTMGIPAVAGVSADLDDLPEGTTVAMDGSRGRLWIDPSREVLATLSEHQRAWLERRAQALEASQEGAVTRDGRRIEVAANVGNAADARLAAKNGAEGIGLLRTEFLYLTRETPPTEEEQRQALAEIGEAMGSAPVIVRTLDVGGDKPLPYIQLPPEANPFLGVRAIRLSFKEIDLFKAQLRAILRAGVTANLRIMFPMVTGVGEVIHARDLLEQAHRALLSEGIPHQWPIETGIMVEIPSAALLSSPLADHVDFFSIGTNDLTQYTLAAERGNPALTELADGLHPAVLRLIRLVANSARAQGKWTGVCGELAGDLAAVPVLVGLGVDELSVNPGSVPEVKLLIRSLSMDRVEKLAESLLESESAQEARSLAVSFLEETRGR